MAEPPKTPRWYIAELVEELILNDNIRNVSHRKTQVIFADSHRDAYEKALSLSTEHETSYLNQTHKQAQTRYWGLNELNVLDGRKIPPLPVKPLIPHYRKFDQLTPEEVMALIWIQRQALPN